VQHLGDDLGNPSFKRTGLGRPLKSNVSPPRSPFLVRILFAASVVAQITLAGCSHPQFVPTSSGSSALVEFRNGSTGYTQQYFFEEPVSCKGPSVITSVGPQSSKSVRMPAGQPITIWTSAWGLPAPAGMVAWCRPSAFSSRLVAGRSYRVEFVADASQKKCGVVLTSTDDQQVKLVSRKVDGPEIAGGPLTKAFSCSQSDDLSAITR